MAVQHHRVPESEKSIGGILGQPLTVLPQVSYLTSLKTWFTHL